MQRIPCTRARLAALLLAVTTITTACSGGEEAPAGKAPSPEGQGRPAAHVTSKWPFTGETFHGKLPKHRAVMVKIENTSSSKPQRGLGSADLVVEELVEGGLTRLAAFYYSSQPSEVGPVRSLRGTDIGVVKPSKGVAVASGGAPVTMRRVRQAHVVTATEGTKGYYRVSDRPSPYNLFMNLKQLPADKLKGPRPQPYLPFGSATDLGKGQPAEKVTAKFSAGTSTEWTWTRKGWKQSGGYAAKGDEFKPDNVLALRVRQVDAGYTDPAGNPVPESVFSGKGAATLLTDGKAYEGTWMKKGMGGSLKLVTAKGERLPVPPGNTWIELIPASGGGLSISK
ncbi:MAG: DUF3048 domain-containing protein [Nocardioidaceae bacterium]